MPATMPAKKMKVLETLRLAEGYLAARGVESARLNAEHLLAKRMGCSRLDLYLRFDRDLAPEVLGRYREDLKLRGTHYPLQYILGEIEFMSLPFRIREGIFIPRPETELLVEWIDELVGGTRAIAFVEFGVGSGIIAGSLCRRHPGWKGVAIDVAAGAVALARENFETLGVADRMDVRVADGLHALEAKPPFDLLVANPPYVPTAEIPALETEVSRPVLAREARRLLVPGGLAAFEIGHGQAGPAREICERAGLERISMRKDYNGLERMITAFVPDAGAGDDG
jgi:release factor glutamine methyltransferase